MKIRQIIAEEIMQMLVEVDGEQVAAALSKIEGLPDDVAQKIIAKLEPVAKGAVEKLGREGAVTEGDEDPPGDLLSRAAASALVKVPGGLDIGATYLAALDRATPSALRVAFLIAVVNLISPVDVGTLLGLDFLGPLGALDDYLLVKKLIIDKFKKAGYPKEEHFDRMQELAGEEVENPEATPQEKGLPGDYRPPAGGPAQAARKARRAAERGEEELQEMKIKTSQLYKIIQEELEVVLTNEEAKEIFDLDMSALLDEMMEEGLPFMKDVERSRQGKIPPAQAAKIKAASTAMQTRAGDPSRTSQGSEEEEEDLTKPTEVSEITTVSTDDLYLAEMFDTGSDTKESCAAKGGQWNEASQKCEFLEEAEDKSFSKAAKEIEKKGTEGVFTAKAKKAGMGVQAYAAKVLKKGSKASTKTKRQAAFAKGAATVARENK